MLLLNGQYLLGIGLPYMRAIEWQKDVLDAEQIIGKLLIEGRNGLQ